MLVIRMQRTGRSGHAQFRVVAQDKRFSPTSGRVVAYLGNYDPHAKTISLDKEKIEKYLANGAQPSDRLIKLFKKEGLKTPSWAVVASPKKKAVRNPDKRRSTRPEGAPVAEPKAEVPTETTADEAAAEPTEPAAEQHMETQAPEAAEELNAEPEDSTTNEKADKASAEAEPQAKAETRDDVPTPAEETPTSAPAESEKPADK